jgi:hypothetical protein
VGCSPFFDSFDGGIFERAGGIFAFLLVARACDGPWCGGGASLGATADPTFDGVVIAIAV